MRKLVPLLLLTAIPIAPRPVPAAAPSAYEPGRALVRFQPGTPSAIVLAAHARAGARLVRTIPTIGYQLVAFDPSLPLEVVLSSYRNDPSVLVAEPNRYATIAAPANDPCLTGACGGVAGQWAIAMTNAEGAWETFPTAAQKRALPRVTVAVLDTKLDAAHPDFANAGSPSTDAGDGGQIDTANARDWIPASQQSGAALYHGTYVAGLVAAATGNGTGVAALGHRATVLPLTVVDGTGRADAASLAEAIVYAWAKGARVVNLSLGLTSDSAAVHDAIRAVTGGSSPSLVVAAAGNNTGSAPFYPGSYPEVLSVSGTSRSDTHASCANHNGNVSVSAPAERVVSLDFGGGTVAPQCGTSAAAPQVSALAALLFAQDPSRTPAEVRRIIERSADDLGPAGRDDRFGHGRINAERALRAGPVVTLPRASVPIGGSSTVTASASAAPGVKAARAFVGSRTATPVALAAADGGFGGAVEALRGTITLPPATPAGPHPIWVEAFDGATWGPSAVGVVIVDAAPPAITSVGATNAIRATAQAAVVSFTLADDVPNPLAAGIQVFDASNNEVYREARANLPHGRTTFTWSPAAAVLPGPYQIKVVAADVTGKSSATMVGIVVA